jgi:N-acetylneuraminic acid mutarotase
MTRVRLKAVLVALVVLPLGAPAIASSAGGRGEALTLEARVACQTAVEEVYWRNRAWPEENSAPKPSLHQVMPESAIRAKVDGYLRATNALERYWGRSITGQQLQAELDRQATQSRHPQTLRELWAAVGNDPMLGAECLARPILVDRMLRSYYANDDRFHGALEARARGSLARYSTPTQMSGLDGATDLHWVRRAPGSDARGPTAVEPSEWDAHVERIARQVGGTAASLRAGQVSGLREDQTRFYALGVVERSPERLRLVSVEWEKQPFETWWASVRTDLPATVDVPDHRYRLPVVGAGSCLDDTWKPTKAIPDPRYEHTGVWTGTELIVFAGMNVVGEFLEDNGRYSPATDSWTPVSRVNAPPLRAEHTAVWTGTEMIVWGGFGLTDGRDGGRYDPATDTWRDVNTSGAPPARADHAAVWTGSQMIVWGGDSPTNTGGRYDPVTDTWQPTSTAGAPSPRFLVSAVWTGREMIIWGGFDGTFTYDDGARYNPLTNSWRPVSDVNAPSFRHFHSGIWTGDVMVIWGGVGKGFGLSTGGRYDPETDTWRDTSTTGAPTPRWLHEAVWTGSEMIVWGGALLLRPHPRTGGRYDPVTDTWIATNTLNAPEGREDLVAVWTGTELIVWGGLGDDFFVNTGGRYDPSTDSWLPTQTYDVPVARGLHTAAWTGAEMLIYGGDLGGRYGGLYDPATDTWRPNSVQNAPAGIQNMTSVWTGTEVIVWGGFPDSNEGGRYNPTTDTWRRTSLRNAPSQRYHHSAVWTGQHMIVWGGLGAVNTGGRYDPASNTWTPTSTAGAPPGRENHAAVWTGTEMIVWGGYPERGVRKTGGRYDPAANTWAPTSQIGAPSRRSDPSSVWTGTEMIVWGGYSIQDIQSFRSGARYDPATDSWTPTSLGNAPSARVTPAVWTGDEMIVWGGVLTDNTGGRYNPLSDTWRDTSQVDAPQGRWNTTLVWTGEQMIAWGGILWTATGGLYCAVQEGNIPPVARSDAYDTEMATPLVVEAPGVLANDGDGNGDPLTATLVEGPPNGTVDLDPDGSFTYTPAPGFAGFDRFTYQASDGEALSNVATVTIGVSCVTNCLRVDSIIMDVLIESIRARVFIRTETGAPVEGATVSGTWTVPGGGQEDDTGITNANGLAILQVFDDRYGTYTITINDVDKAGLTFDPVNSLLIERISR